MDTSQVSIVLQEGLWVVMKIGGPLLLLSMLVGIILAIFQAVTQIHEQTLSFVFKLAVVITVLLIGGGWMMQNLLDYTEGLYTLMRS
ncbi:MAG: flagellar biosynthetic protein FliQ [Firmicutes bacterium]|nr:flagellar biosynthetic protein FliQ [Bacillota bacterium]